MSWFWNNSISDFLIEFKAESYIVQLSKALLLSYHCHGVTGSHHNPSCKDLGVYAENFPSTEVKPKVSALIFKVCLRVGLCHFCSVGSPYTKIHSHGKWCSGQLQLGHSTSARDCEAGLCFSPREEQSLGLPLLLWLFPPGFQTKSIRGRRKEALEIGIALTEDFSFALNSDQYYQETVSAESLPVLCILHFPLRDKHLRIPFAFDFAQYQRAQATSRELWQVVGPALSACKTDQTLSWLSQTPSHPRIWPRGPKTTASLVEPNRIFQLWVLPALENECAELKLLI